MKKVIKVVLVLLIVLGGGGYLLAQEADAAEPGDTLYPIDILAENIQRLVTFDDLKSAELETEILAERVAELEALSDSDTDLSEVLAAVSEQQDRVQQKLGDLEANADKYQDGELEQIQNQYELQLEQHIQVMQQVENNGEESALEVKEKLEENLEQCGTGTCGTTKEDTGNSDGTNGNSSNDDTTNGNSDSDNGSTNGNGNN
ncbi:MAG: DUF5667 domain-containing protein [Candidatus Dojkabacteria bacterium]|nr:DUF5667 domain-containing protein [Candidatus Dojkabacteria bacterium]